MLSSRVRAAVLGAAGAALVAGSMVTAAGSASADLVTRCVGEAGAVTVPGDLVVPRAKSCYLDGTTVLGDVRVRSDANLLSTGVDLRGRVTVAENGYFETRGSSVADRVTSRSGFGVYLVASDLYAGAAIRYLEGTTVQSFLYPEDSSVTGSVRVDYGQVVIDGSSVGGSVVSSRGDYVDVLDSEIDGRLSVTRNRHGSVVCDSEIYGNGRFTANSDLLQLGAHEPITLCHGSTYWGRNLRVDDNTATIDVSNNIIRGNLGGTGNDPAPTGANNRVRGTVSGQFVDLPPPEDARQRASFGTDHRKGLRAAAAERRAAASAAANEAGPARL